MRSTQDVIDNLIQEAEGRGVTALVVGFEHMSEVIFSDDPNALMKLNGFVRQGGQPIGFIWSETSGKESSITCSLLEEFEDESWAREYMQTFIAATAISLRQQFAAARVTGTADA